MKPIKTLLEAETEPMDEKTTELFTKCVLSEQMHGQDVIPEDYDGAEPHNIVQKRLDMADANVSRWVVAFVVTMAPGPGDCVLWAHALKKLSEKVDFVDMAELAEAFPHGFPTEAERRSCWESQKGFNLGLEDVDNYLDTQEAWVA